MKTATAIKDSDADLICLQEVRCGEEYELAQIIPSDHFGLLAEVQL